MTQHAGSAPLRIGFVGLQPGGGWGTRAHLPALAALKDEFVVVGVANSSGERSRRAAAVLGLPRAFDSVDELVAAADVVAVTVKVPHHYALVGKALAAGKHVYCEWPLGNGLDEARDLAARAERVGVVAVAGTQGLFAPEVVHLRSLVEQDFVGRILSTSVQGVGGTWGAAVPQASAYTLDRRNGANLLTIPVGHTLAAITRVMGKIAALSAVLETRRPSVAASDADAVYVATSPDQVLVTAVLESGVPLSLHFRGGEARGLGFCWEIAGTEGDLRVTAQRGQTQLVQLHLEGGRGDQAYQLLPIPEDLAADATDGPVAGNVRRVYAAMARDIRTGTRLAPSFADAVAVHRIVAAIELSAKTGRQVRPDSL